MRFRLGSLRAPLTGTMLCLAGACAGSVEAPNLTITQVSESIFTAVGVTAAPSYENWGHTNNLSFIIGGEAVLVVNGGDNYQLAKALHRQIKKRTPLPVKWVVNENGQGHPILGKSYWAERGVQIIAQDDAVREIRERGTAVPATMMAREKDRGDKTMVVVPTVSFTESKTLDLGGTEVELKRFGHAHSPGDISVWIGAQKILIAGDIAFHERLLGVFPDTDVRGWLLSFQRMMALQPVLVVPGHGRPTQIEDLKTYTDDYLSYLVSLTTDLAGVAETAEHEGVPIVLYISRSDCTFCRRLEREVLGPLIKAGVFDTVMFRELQLDGAASVIGFDGTELAPQTLAVRYHADITPTILFLDAQGKELIPRISGYTKNDYYSFYLERAIGKAQRLVVKQAL